MKILYLPVRKQWYDMEAAGIKKEEYRRITPFWVKRLLWDADYNEPIDDADAAMEPRKVSNAVDAGCFTFREYTHVMLTSGYPKKDDASRRALFPIEGMHIGCGRTEWGAPDGEEVFIISLGKRITETA